MWYFGGNKCRHLNVLWSMFWEWNIYIYYTEEDKLRNSRSLSSSIDSTWMGCLTTVFSQKGACICPLFPYFFVLGLPSGCLFGTLFFFIFSGVSYFCSCITHAHITVILVEPVLYNVSTFRSSLRCWFWILSWNLNVHDLVHKILQNQEESSSLQLVCICQSIGEFLLCFFI